MQAKPRRVPAVPATPALPYTVLDRLSSGGTAEVFRARRTSDGGAVALKRLLPALANDPEYVAMFADEARIASQLAHPRIARVLDVGQDGDTWYMAQEFVDGPDLRDVMLRSADAHRRMSVPAAIYAVMEIADALEYAHNRIDPQGRPLGLIHRDVSPQNILIGPDADMKLCDFGIAKAEHRETQTRTGMIKGKFSYMSPEQAGGLALDGRSDIFSLATILFELITGERLFAAGSDLETLDRVRRAMVPVPSTLNPAVAEDLDQVLLKALARSRRSRHPTAAAFRSDLAPHLGPGGPDAARRELVGFVNSLFGTRRTATPPPPPATLRRVQTPPPLPAHQGTRRPPPPPPAATPTAAAKGPFEECPTADWTGPFAKMGPPELDLDLDPTPVDPPRVPGAHQPPAHLARSASDWVTPALGIACALLAITCLALVLIPRPAPPRASLEVAMGAPARPTAAPGSAQAPTVTVAVAVQTPPKVEPAAAPPKGMTSPPTTPVAKTAKIAKTRTVRPVAKSRPRPTGAASRVAVAARTPKPPAPRPRVSPRRPSVRPTPPPPKFGLLNLNSRPWAEVYVDGRKVGVTPLYRHRLPAGPHEITLVNNRFGLRKELTVRVKSGQTKPLVVDLD